MIFLYISMGLLNMFIFFFKCEKVYKFTIMRARVSAGTFLSHGIHSGKMGQYKKRTTQVISV